MVLTPSRWFPMLLLACAVVAVTYLPPRDIAESSRWSPYAWAAIRATPRTRLALAAERWAALSEQQALVRARPTSDVPELIVRSGLRPEVSQAVDTILRTIWSRVPRADTTIRLRVVASAHPSTYTGTLDLWAAAEAPEVLLPEQTDGHTCLVIIPGVLQQGDQDGFPHGWWRDTLRRQIGWAVSPCVLRAVLGAPGAEVARWMAARGYDLGASIRWALGGTTGLQYYDFWFDRYEWRETGMPELTMRIVGVLPAPYQYAGGAAGCAGGRVRRCAELITRTPKRGAPNGPIRIADGYLVRNAGLSGQNASFVADLIADRGLDNFRRFWRSPLPVEAAFEEAYGTSLDDWTRGWVRQRVGTVELGAPLHVPGVLAGLLVVVLVVALTAMGAASREIA